MHPDTIWLMKNIILSSLFALSLIQNASWAQSIVEPLKAIEMKSQELINKAESCSEVIDNHVELVDESERFIHTLVMKKSLDISAYEVTMLQKILTNRFLHLTKAVNMYRDTEKSAACSPRLFGNAIAIYDFTQLGTKALKDSKLRRIILKFTNFPKYKLTKLRELYDHYTSNAVVSDFLYRVKLENVTLPESLVHDQDAFRAASFYALSDIAISGTNTVVSGTTRVWGFISDQLKWRNGRLNKNQEALELVKSSLKPLDLIYEKRDFTLSNYTIPGHWGHVAVWLGTKEELIELGVWDKDFFAPFRRFVEEGKNIVEVRKKGVNASSLENFMNLDEVAITRVKDVASNAESILTELVDQIDKKYDFTFNAQSTDKLTCSEFIAFSYGDIRWPETKALFQISIKPDDLALLTLYKNSPSEFVLYLKGHKDGTFDNFDITEWSKLFGKKVNEDLSYN